MKPSYWTLQIPTEKQNQTIRQNRQAEQRDKLIERQTGKKTHTDAPPPPKKKKKKKKKIHPKATTNQQKSEK